jgi:hypothetical protein
VNTTRFALSRMDCAAEERLVPMTLQGVRDVHLVVLIQRLAVQPRGTRNGLDVFGFVIEVVPSLGIVQPASHVDPIC